MKVLILSCNTGQGHNSVASAITERLNKRGIDCDTVDALGYISKSMSKIVAFGHIFLYCRMPGTMKTVFDVSEKNRDYFGEDAPIGKLLSKAAVNLYEYC